MIEQVHLVDLSNEELLDFLGYCYEKIKDLEELLKNDEEILELEAKLKDLKNEKYSVSIKAYKAQLRAARSLAKAKNLQFALPETADERQKP